MEYYLVRLTYTAAAWSRMVQSTNDIDERLGPVRKLLRELGGSLATFSFFDSEHYVGEAHRVADKFALFGEHDLLTILATPDRKSAAAFRMAVLAEDGLKAVDLTPMMPLAEAISAMPVAKEAIAASGYSAPGRSKPD